MRWLTVFLFIPCLSSAQIDFNRVAEAKAYLFNIEQKKGRPDAKIFADGSYASSTMPVAKPVSIEDLAKLKKLLSSKTAALEAGLSKCFIPRHGIVFHDAKGDVVGSLSICFQCEAIRIWPKEQLVGPKRIKEKKALKQLDVLRSVLENTGWKVLENPDEYQKLF